MKQTLANLIIAAALVSAPLSAALAASDETVSIRAGSLPLVREIDERFQSFQVGMSHLTGGETWRSYDSSQQDDGKTGAPKEFSAVREPRPPADLSNPRLRTLAAALGPFYVRYGGTTSNSVYFQDDDEPQLAKAPEGYTVVLTRAAWKGAFEFAKAVDAKVVTGFTVSSGVRDSSGAWTPRIAAPWLAYTRAIGGEIYAGELFNEPNAPEPGRMPKGQSASDFARDFAAFRSFMTQAAPNVKLAGPGVATLGVPVPVPSLEGTTPEQYMTADPKLTFDIVSYHFYGALAERCAPADSPVGISADRALSEEWLARPDDQFQKHKALRDRHAPGAPIWLTETGAAACGGTKWQPTFLDTFRYLDTQARLAKQGLDAMFTHALISGSNGVIDEKTLQPNADYWAALLWRKLMGTRVLDAGPIQQGLHMYAHCQRGAAGGVTVLAINLEKTLAKIDFSGPADLYALTASELQSKTVLLNGQPLALGADDTLPVLKPTRLKGKGVTLAPTSVNFIALPKAKNASCAG
jgi:heparanase